MRKSNFCGNEEPGLAVQCWLISKYRSWQLPELELLFAILPPHLVARLVIRTPLSSMELYASRDARQSAQHSDSAANWMRQLISTSIRRVGV